MFAVGDYVILKDERDSMYNVSVRQVTAVHEDGKIETLVCKDNAQPYSYYRNISTEDELVPVEVEYKVGQKMQVLPFDSDTMDPTYEYKHRWYRGKNTEIKEIRRRKIGDEWRITYTIGCDRRAYNWLAEELTPIVKEKRTSMKLKRPAESDLNRLLGISTKRKRRPKENG
jgi:hypothetical protein